MFRYHYFCPVPVQWIYALGAALEKPVHSDVSATLRSLMKRVAVLRAGILQVLMCADFLWFLATLESPVQSKCNGLCRKLQFKRLHSH